MKATPRHNSDGIALIMVMCAIVVLSALAAGFALSMKVETRLAQNANSEEQLLWQGVSGVQYACWILSQHPLGEPFDSLNQKWAGGAGSLAESNSVLSSISLDNIPVGDGTVSIKIIDLERFANINTATETELQQVLTVMGVDANDISVVSDSILDWIDSDDLPRVAGAESDYYQGLNPPYYAKNAPIDDLSELQYIKGVTQEIYTGHSTNQPSGVFHYKLGFGASPGQPHDYLFGLTNVFTPFSNGKININTADKNVLQTIPGVDAAVADAIIKQRAGPDGVDGTEDDMPFSDPGQLGSFGIKDTSACGIRSSTYKVLVTAQLGDVKRVYVAILARTSGTDFRVVSFYWQ
ncbi:MAG: helix-hairpin-helix domain-containing protein [Verrucomicrobiota bacterium]|jgi:general secretion pathway protein K